MALPRKKFKRPTIFDNEALQLDPKTGRTLSVKKLKAAAAKARSGEIKIPLAKPAGTIEIKGRSIKRFR